jgi:hypothetical protein
LEVVIVSQAISPWLGRGSFRRSVEDLNGPRWRALKKTVVLSQGVITSPSIFREIDASGQMLSIQCKFFIVDSP